MHRAQNFQDYAYQKHLQEVVAPEEQRRRQQELAENDVMQRRMEQLAQAQARQRQIYSDLRRVHHAAVEDQIRAKRSQELDVAREKEVSRAMTDQ